ncbi:MAG: ABC transporter [Spirochaetes bacterium]|nr:MAG: ABC transporter [Spirochaetota bacterium]
MKKKSQEIILLCLMVGILFFTALNSNLYFKRFDVTENRVYTISDVSRNLFKEIPEQVHMTYYISEKLDKRSPIPGQIEDLLNEYAVYSRGKITVSVVDPVKEGSASQAERLGVIPQQMEVVEQSEKSVAVVYSGIVIQYLDRFETLPFVLQTETLEYELTSKIRKVVKNEEKSIGILVGDAGRTLSQDYALLQDNLSGDYTVREIKRGEGIPDDISVLFVLGNKDFSKEDLLPIDRYIMNGGRVLFCVEGVYVDMMRNLEARKIEDSPLYDMLRNYGVEVEQKLVLDEYARDFRIPQQFFGSIAWQVIGKYPHWVAVIRQNVLRDNPLTARFSGLDLLWPSPLKKLDVEGVKAEELLKTSPRAWTMEKNFDTNPYNAHVFQATRSETEGQYVLAYALTGMFPAYFGENGDSNQEEEIDRKSPETRMLVIGDSDFASNLIQFSASRYNLTFLENIAEWLASEDDLLRIKTRVARDIRLNTIQDPDTEKAVYFFSQIVNVVLIPLLVILYGINRFLRRRKRRYLEWGGA